MSHWCRDLARDEAVRAAEDGRTGPLPTLEEAIASVTNHDAQPGARVSDRQCASPADTGADTELSRAGQFTPPEAPQEQKCTERESGLRTERVVPPAPESRPAETRLTSAGMVPGGWWFPPIDKPAPPPPPAPPRVHRGSGVFDANGDEVPWEGVVAMLTDERDAAIRDLRSVTAERAKLEEQLESVACRAATAENRVAELESAAKLAPAANADGKSNHTPAASAVLDVIVDMTDILRLNADPDEKHAALSTLVEAVCPGYVLAPAASGAAGTGWLTAEERAAIQWAISEGFDEEVLRNLLARSSPPEVVLTAVSSYENAPGNRVLAACDVISAIRKAGCEVVTPSHWQIAVAGVPWKEVAK